MPQFVDLPGGYVPNPPFLHTGATLHMFLVQGQRDALQALVDGSLNKIPNVHFELVTDLVLVTGLYVEKVTATSLGWNDRGSTPEADVGFWLLTYGGPNGEPPQARWWPVYLFVDSAAALVVGREIYGFPKYYADISRRSPGDPNDPCVQVQTEYFKVFDPAASPTTGVLFQIAPAAGGPLTGFWDALVRDLDLSQLLTFVGRLIGDAANALAPGLPYLGMPMVFLKQFRDIAAADAVAFQAIASLTITPTAAPTISLLTDPIELTIETCASLPIATQLGLRSPTAPVGPAIRIGMSFVAGFGRTLA